MQRISDWAASAGLLAGLCALPLTASASPPEREVLTDLAADADPEADSGDGDAASGDADAESVAVAGPRIVKLKQPKWIKHVIIPGERLTDIAARYDVRAGSLIRWNKLDEKNPKIFAGRELSVYTKRIPPPQQKITYTVQFGDTWSKIANAHHVDADVLRKRWNPKVPRAFKAGQKLVIWIDPLNDPKFGRRAVKAAPAISALLVPIPPGSMSVGKPNSGQIAHSAQLPANKKLYTLRKPDEAFGSTHTLENLQLAIANWRQATGYTGALLIGSISKQGGGKLKPHSSHRSGRDVDIRLPLKRKTGSADDVNDVDWDALWGLVVALVDTGQVTTIYLTTDRQAHLAKAARRAGASKKTIERILQYPEKSGHNNGIVRHQKGHTAHIHVRFACADNETRCENH